MNLPAPPQRAARRVRLFWPLTLVTLTAAVLAAGYVLRSRAADGAPSSGMEPAAAAGDETHVVCLGYVDVDGGVIALSPIGLGRVVDVPVHENDSVTADAVLLQLDDRLARADLEEAEAARTAAQAQLTEARQAPQRHQFLLTQQKAAVAAVHHEVVAARIAAERKQRMVQSDRLAREELDTALELAKKAEAAEQVEQARLDALALHDPNQLVTRAEQDLRAKNAAVEKARQALRECVVRAPVDGTVLRLLVSRGDVIGPLARQPALLFCPNRPRIVRAEVEQEFADRINLGCHVTVEDETSTAGRTWQGKAVHLSDWFTQRRTVISDPTALHDVRTMECLIELDSGQPQPRIGQRVRVKFSSEPSP
jgi:multidrug resistance efflux pump